MCPGGGWATSLRAWHYARLDVLQWRPLPGKGLSPAPWGMGSQFPKTDSIPEASGSSKFWIFPPPSLLPHLPPPFLLSLFQKHLFPRICPAPLALSDPPPKKKNKDRGKQEPAHRGLGEVRGQSWPQRFLPGLERDGWAMFTEVHWPWRGPP